MKRGWLSITLTGALLAGAGGSLYGACGPFTDVAADAFCSFVFEVFALGITTGTTATTYDPTGNVSRLQMAAFLSRSVDGTLRRGGKRAALNQFWNTGGAINLGITTVGFNLNLLQSDGTDIWAADNTAVQRLRGGDGRVLETWTEPTAPTVCWSRWEGSSRRASPTRASSIASSPLNRPAR
jgi:hypothetical protein